MKKTKNKKSFTFLKKPATKQFICLLLVFITFSSVADLMAQAQGAPAIDAIVTEVKKYFKSLSNLLYVIVAIAGLIGAAIVTNKFQSGDPNAQKHLVGWLTGIIFSVLAVFFLQKMYGI
jgi:hypothetical protein